ncbi:hypothetical protein KKI24_25010 [bacterium]|nr:hypothetical protein [bacterium]
MEKEAEKNTALADILQTREVRQALSDMLPDLLDIFAKESKIGKFVLKRVGRYLKKRLDRPQDSSGDKELQRLFADPQFIENISQPLSDALNGAFDILGTIANTVDAMPSEGKKKLFNDITSTIPTVQTGALVNWACRRINRIHQEDPEFFAKTLAPGFQKWVESVDFGEIREMFDNSGEDRHAFVKMVNTVLWQYPAKMVMILSLLPSLVNLLTDTLDISVGRLNELPPDMLTDVILSFVREINSDSVAGVFGQLTEITRKIHTGSALLGEPGAPQLPRVLSGKIDEIVAQIDPSTLWKARIALAETKAVIGQAFAAAVNSQTELRLLNRTMGPALTNIRLKAINQRLSAWESQDDEEMAKSLELQLSAYDVQELAEVLNNTLRIINRLGDEKPALYTGFASEFVSAVDSYELAEASRRLFNGVSQEFKPLARATVPGLVTWICDVIKPADDEYEDDAARARNALRSLFATEEV